MRKKMLTVDKRPSLGEDDLLLRCFVPSRLWKVRLVEKYGVER